MDNKVSAITFEGRRVIGILIRHIDAYSSVVYAGGYESLIVPRESITIL